MTIKLEDLRKKTEDELQKLLGSLEGDLRKTTQTVFEGKEKNVRKIGLLKKDRARLKTILNERKLSKGE